MSGSRHHIELVSTTAEDVFAVDGDTLAYRTAAVCEEHFEGSCRDVIDKSVEEIIRLTGISHFRMYLSDKINFRRFINNSYKANRNTMKRPQFLQYCCDYLAEYYGAISVTGFEADDCIATDMVKTGAFHCGVDKDLLQIAGRHYNYVKKEWIEISETDANLNLYRQVLMGDTSDNIKGLPKVGEKKAFDFIQNPATAFDDAFEAYKNSCGTIVPAVDPREYFIEQYNLVRMMKNVSIQIMNTYHVKVAALDLSGDFENLSVLEMNPQRATQFL